METLKHKSLGTFRRKDCIGDLIWHAKLELPAFSVFKYYGNGKSRRTKIVEVSIFQEAPSEEAFKVLTNIKKNQKGLVKRIKLAFLNDFNSEGPDSGMWWRSDPAELALSCREIMEKRLKRDRVYFPNDLDVLLHEPSIEISYDVLGDPTQTRCHIDFGATFEIEHGVSVLTDGKNVLGLGYSGEADPYNDYSHCPRCGTDLLNTKTKLKKNVR